MTTTSPSKPSDVVILGGGLAGLCLAIQLKQARDDLKIVVLEKLKHPVPEAAHKVGESTVEIAGRYFADVLGMREHLEKHQLLKPGLRFYFNSPNRGDVTSRVEYGFTDWPKIPTFQIDRGRFENALAVRAKELGVDFRDSAKVTNVELSEEGNHTVAFERAGQSHSISARWVVDGSGRTSLLKRKLDLAEDVDHPVAAAWFRVTEPLDLEDLSEDPTWKQRAPKPDLRRLATNHLMGPGYWVWFIPLAGGAEKGSTSIGIVADTNIQSFDSFNNQERALAWLDENEPQAAKLIRASEDKIVDFHTLRRFAMRSKRVYSPNRWALIGDAGPFTDPFLSPGSDTIYITNSFVTNLILVDKEGEDITEMAEGYNEFFFALFDSILSVYQHNYPIFGNTQVMALKVHFDYYSYWGYFALLAYHDKLTDFEFFESIGEEFARADIIYDRMQVMFRKWNELDKRPRKPAFFDQSGPDAIPHMFHRDLDSKHPDEKLRERIIRNFGLIDEASVSMFRHAVRCCLPEHAERVEGRAINPVAISLDPDKWEEEGLFDDSQALEVSSKVQGDVAKLFFEVA